MVAAYGPPCDDGDTHQQEEADEADDHTTQDGRVQLVGAGALMPAGIVRLAQCDTPGGVSLPQRTQWLTGCPPGTGDRKPPGSDPDTWDWTGERGSATGSDTPRSLRPGAFAGSQDRIQLIGMDPVEHQLVRTPLAPGGGRARRVGQDRRPGRRVTPWDVDRNDDASRRTGCDRQLQRVEIHRQQTVEDAVRR